MTKYSLLTILLVLSFASVSFAQVPQSSHVFIVVEENTNFSDVIGNPAMPYLNSLANRYGLATNYFANTHPSIGNYFMLITGEIITNDDGFSGTVSANNIVRQILASGKTWKAYEEDLPSVGYLEPDTGGYARRHCPLSYLSDVVNSSTQRNNLVPFTQFAQDLANNQLPNFSFITPNLCNDAHDCPLTDADTWLQNNLDLLITSPAFQNDGLLVIVFDEAGSDDTNGGGKIAWVAVGPKVNNGFKSTNFYQHQNTLRLLSEALGLTNFPGAAATAANMAEFFGNPAPPQPPTAVLTVTPQSGNAPLTVVADSSGSSSPNGSIASRTIDFGDGTVSTSTKPSHTYNPPGTFTVQLTVTDNLGLTASVSQTVVVNSATNQPPSCTLSVSPSSGQVPLQVTATAACTDPENNIVSTVMDWGDGSSTNGSNGSHNYPVGGSYTVRVTATDSGKLTGTATQTVTATDPPPSGNGIPSNLFGLHMILGNYPTVSFGVLRSSGVAWTHIQPSRGTFDWSTLDSQVSVAQAHGLKFYYATDGVPSWTSSSNLADWDAFVTALVQRYKGKIEVYELWNEPDQDSSVSNMANFVALTQRFHDVIRANDPAALIASPAATGDMSWYDGYWASGGVKDIDVVAFHGYLSGVSPEELDSQLVTPLKGIVSKHGLSSKPIWDSEGSWGGPNVLTDQQAQIAFVARFYLLHQALGIQRFYWYSWDDNGDGPGGVGWGTLFNPNTHTALPAAGAYQQIYNWMVGATMTAPCAVSNSVWTCGLTTAAGGATLAVWSPGGLQSYPVGSQYAQYKDLLGNTATITGTSVLIGPEPILLIGATNPPPTNQPPSCTLSVSPSSGQVPLQVTATATCTDPQNNIVSTVMDWGDGSSTNGSNGSHSYAVGGSYTVRVTATDSGKLTGTAAQTVTATNPLSTNQPPSCTLSVSPSRGRVPLQVTATATCTDPQNNIVSTVMDWGDGSSTNGSSGTHTFTHSRTYTVRVTATDSGQLTGSASWKVTAMGAARQAGFALSTTPSSQTHMPGTVVKYVVTVTDLGGDNGMIHFHVRGLPHGATARFSPPAIENAGSSMLTITLGNHVPPGDWDLTIIGRAHHVVHSTSIGVSRHRSEHSTASPGAGQLSPGAHLLGYLSGGLKRPR